VGLKSERAGSISITAMKSISLMFENYPSIVCGTDYLVKLNLNYMLIFNIMKAMLYLISEKITAAYFNNR